MFLNNHGDYVSLTECIPTSYVKLDNGIIPSQYLPTAFADDIIEGYYYNLKFYTDSGHGANNEITPAIDKIYVDKEHDNDIYRYTGTSYVKIGDANGDFQTNMMSVVQTLTGDVSDISAFVSGLPSGLNAHEEEITQLQNNIEDLSGNVQMNYLTFEVPQIDSDSSSQYKVVIDFYDNADMTGTPITYDPTADASNFKVYSSTNGTLGNWPANSMQLLNANDTVRFDLADVKTSGYTYFKWRWAKIGNGNVTKYGFGSTNSIPLIDDSNFNSKLDDLHNAVYFELSGGLINLRDVVIPNLPTPGSGMITLKNGTTTLDSFNVNQSANKEIQLSGLAGSSLDVVSVTSNVTAASNSWLVLLSNASTITLPTSNISNGDIIKVTANSTAIANGTVQVNGTISGENSGSWASISPLVIDVPQTITLMYLNNAWNLVESNIL